ncbi:MAG: hypothetical protein MSC30_19390 [Gaiellaceae bacterium MAG52_C11]|nr:hypothetical protein [Candidatus Gaiellasilicea maunaloa]
MSGPKSLSYSVVETEAQLRQRERRRLDEQRRQLSAERDRLLVRAHAAREAGEGVISEPSVTDPMTLSDSDNSLYAQALEEVRRQLAKATHALDSEVLEGRKSALLSRLTSPLAERDIASQSAAEALAAQRATRAEATTPSSREGREDRAETIARVVGRLDVDAPTEARERIDSAAALTLHEASDAVAERALDSLRLDVQQVNERSRMRRKTAVQVNALRQELADVASPGASMMRRRLDQYEQLGEPLPDSLPGEVQSLRVAAQRDDDRATASRALRSSLTELGYEVGEDFDRLLLERGFADAHQAGWRGYAVRIRSDPSSSSLGFNVVRGAGDSGRQRARDREVEQSWCADFRQLLDRLDARGVPARLTRQTPAGDVPVLVVSDLPSDTERSRLEWTDPDELEARPQ